MSNEEILRSIKYAHFVRSVSEQIQNLEDPSLRRSYEEKILSLLIDLYPLYIKDVIPNEVIDLFFPNVKEKDLPSLVTQWDYKLPETITKGCLYLIEVDTYPSKMLNRLRVVGYLNKMDDYISSGKDKTLEENYGQEIASIREFGKYYDEAHNEGTTEEMLNESKRKDLRNHYKETFNDGKNQLNSPRP